MLRYAPGEVLRAHTDTHSRINFLVRGDFYEEAQKGAVRALPGDVLLKSRHARHSDIFGATGALIAVLAFLDDDPFDDLGASGSWRRVAGGSALRHAASFLDAALAGDGNAIAVAGRDLLVTPSHMTPASPPAWLERLRGDLEEASLSSVSVSARAREAGAHPAHVSRLFRRCYGVSITDHAQTHSVRRALPALAEPHIALKDIAAAAGFYDQSHMNRVFRRVTGRSPGAHRAMFRAAG
jgi:AraC family transcriptional regulator